MNLKRTIRKTLSSIISRPFAAFPSSALSQADVISLDVFDTLIFRTVAEPEDVFDMISEDPGFKAKRIEAKYKARTECGLEEIRLEAIYRYLPGYDLAVEIAAEMEVCYANPEALHFYNELKADGRKLIIVSDMYLSCDTISAILTKCGYDLGGVKVYVSSEYGKTKKSGNLFREVMREQGTGNILHIGDHIISDYVRPRQAGMKGVLYKV